MDDRTLLQIVIVITVLSLAVDAYMLYGIPQQAAPTPAPVAPANVERSCEDLCAAGHSSCVMRGILDITVCNSNHIACKANCVPEEELQCMTSCSDEADSCESSCQSSCKSSCQVQELACVGAC